MDMTTLLARIFGPYLLLAALMVFANRKALMLNVEAMFQERFAQWLAAMIAILGGLTYVNLYQDWSSLPSGILSTIGWLILFKGLLYAFLPEVRLAKFTKILNDRSWYTMDGILAVIFGVYLSGFGYGLW
jgi:hypothetical protein